MWKTVSTWLAFKNVPPIRSDISREQADREMGKLKPIRKLGLLVSVFALSCVCTSSSGMPWLIHEGVEVSVFDKCFYNITAVALKVPCDKPERQMWQDASIGTMIIVCVACFFGIGLTMAGMCMMSIPKRLYYYHSAAEVFCSCGLLSSSVLLAFPITMSVKYSPPVNLTPVSLGAGYYLGLTSIICNFLAALATNVDTCESCRVCCWVSGYGCRVCACFRDNSAIGKNKAPVPKSLSQSVAPFGHSRSTTLNQITTATPNNGRTNNNNNFASLETTNAVLSNGGGTKMA